jgi:hypothetical protein
VCTTKRSSLLGQSNAQSNTKSNSQNDKHNDQQAPPLKSVTASGMLVRLVDLGVALVYVLSSLDGVLLCVLNDWVLSFYDLSHVCEHSGQFGKSGFDALEFIVAGSDGTEDRGGLAGSVALELFIHQYYPYFA